MGVDVAGFPAERIPVILRLSLARSIPHILARQRHESAQATPDTVVADFPLGDSGAAKLQVLDRGTDCGVM